MVYFKDFEPFHPGKYARRRHLLRFSSYEEKSDQKNEMSLWKIYCEKTSLHGFRHFGESNSSSFEKIVWICVVIISILMSTYMFHDLWLRYGHHALETVVETSQYPVFNIHFPAIGICLRNQINWTKIDAAQTKFLPQNASLRTIDTFREFVQSLEYFRFPEFENFKTLKLLHLESIDFLDLRELMHFMVPKCNEIFDGQCYWRQNPLSCCKIFVLEETEMGLCYVFNSVLSNKSKAIEASDKFYPWRVSKSGDSSALRVRIRIDTKVKIPKNNTAEDGLRVMVKKSDQWSGESHFVFANTETDVIINAEVTNTDERARSLPTEARNCIFKDETMKSTGYRYIPGIQYRQWNCLTRCHQDYVLSFCNCSLPIFFPELGRPCNPSDLLCLYKYQNNLRYDQQRFEENFVHNPVEGMQCYCLKSCDWLSYMVNLNSYPLADTDSNSSVKHINLDAYFQSDVIIRYKTRLEYTFTDLIASAGGIIGIFLGASLISGIEIVYYLTVGFYLHKTKNQKTTNTTNIHKIQPGNVLKNHKTPKF